MTSGYEDQAVDSIEFGDLSDEDLKKIAADDERSTAQEKAQAELNRRDSGDEDDSEKEDNPFLEKRTSLQPEDPKERAEALGLNSEGINLDPDAGQLALQQYANAVEESGVVPPTGSPPSGDETVEAVVERAEAEKQARAEAQLEALKK